MSATHEYLLVWCAVAIPNLQTDMMAIAMNVNALVGILGVLDATGLDFPQLSIPAVAVPNLNGVPVVSAASHQVQAFLRITGHGDVSTLCKRFL